MKKLLTLFLSILVFLPNVVLADTAIISFVELEMIDVSTNDNIKSDSGMYYPEGPINVRCYGYKWKHLDHGTGFDKEKPENYTPQEVLTITEYYKGEYSPMDWTHGIKFKTIDYCDVEYETVTDNTKYVARNYHNLPLDDSICSYEQEGSFIAGIPVCKMKLEVEEVREFDWEKNDINNNNEINCETGECDESNDQIVDYPAPKPEISWWDNFKCWVIKILGGICQ